MPSGELQQLSKRDKTRGYLNSYPTVTLGLFNSALYAVKPDFKQADPGSSIWNYYKLRLNCAWFRKGNHVRSEHK